MPRVTNTAPPRLLNSEMIVLDESGLVGVVTMDTDDGVFELAVNRGVSWQLLELLVEFLQVKDDAEREPPPKPKLQPRKPKKGGA